MTGWSHHLNTNIAEDDIDISLTALNTRSKKFHSERQRNTFKTMNVKYVGFVPNCTGI